MPKATLSRSRALAMLPTVPSEAELEAALFASKAEARWDGSGDHWAIEVTPDRLDLLSEGGLGLYLQGALGSAHGLLKARSSGPSDPAPEIQVDPSVEPLRPHIRAIVVRAPSTEGIEEGLLAEAVRFQEALHATVGLDRRLASLGLYPYDRLQPPFRYTLEPTESVSIIPLERSETMSGSQFLAEHPMALRYGALGSAGERLLSIRDSSGALLSLPPILNARPSGEVRGGDRTILIESTGTRLSRVTEAIGLLSVVFVARGWAVEPVAVRTASSVDAGRSPIEARSLTLRSSSLDAVAGRPYPASEVEHFLSRARLSARAAPHGWAVEVPPWRPDLLQEVDLIEEVVLARGIRAEEGVVPPSGTRGSRRGESRFHRRVGELLLGSGFSEVYSPVLSSEEGAVRLQRTGALRLTNPVSELFGRLRDSIELSLIASLEHNLRHGYPQRFFEIGPVVKSDDRSETGASTSCHAGAMIAEERAGFADAASAVDYLMGAFAAVGVREPAELPGTIPGRAARVRLAGETVAELGEIHPRVLAELRVPVPVVWFELDLSALWPLSGRSEAT
jgi:phenylalanyl-tRNA synthetase beta chain